MNYIFILLVVAIIVMIRLNYNLRLKISNFSKDNHKLEKDLMEIEGKFIKEKDKNEKWRSYFFYFLDEYWHNGENDANRAILMLNNGLRFLNFTDAPLKEYKEDKAYFFHDIYKYEDDITEEIAIKWVGGTKGGKSIFGENVWKLLIEFTPQEIGSLILDISYLARKQSLEERNDVQGCAEKFIQKNPRLLKLWNSNSSLSNNQIK